MTSLLRSFPDKMGVYWEPFIGGGGVLFAIADRFEHANISDKNAELVTTYNVVRSDVELLIDALTIHEREHADYDYFEHVRGSSPPDDIGVASRFIYLNRTCFNGLYRVNKSGRFNVPRGNYKNPRICNANNLRLASAALSNVSIKHGDFSIATPRRNDFVYCDPPYDGCFHRLSGGRFQ